MLSFPPTFVTFGIVVYISCVDMYVGVVDGICVCVTNMDGVV